MIKQTVNEFVDIMNACRSHYLIFNEFPNDGGGGEIPKNLSFFVPSNFFNKTLYAGYAGKNYDFTRVPYGGTGYDIENWLVGRGFSLLTMYFSSDKNREKVKKELDKIFQSDDFKIWLWNGRYSLGVFFKELNGCFENRYF